MRIGILAPVATEDVAHLLDNNEKLLPPGYPGAPFVGTLIETFLQMGHEVVAFTSDKTLGVNGSAQLLEGPGFRLWVCPARPNGTLPRKGSPIGRVWDFFRFERQQLAAAVQREQVDILHAHWTYEFAMVALDSGRPCIATIHDSPADVLRMAPSLYTLGRYLMAKTVLRSDMPMTAVSPFVGSAVSSKFAEGKIALVSNPLPLWLSCSIDTHNETGSTDSTFSIAMVLGSWTKFKNPLPAIHAFCTLAKEIDKPIELRLYGADFSAGGKAEQEIRKAQLPLTGIRFCGRYQHKMLLAEIQRADVLLHPSLTESFGMAVAEAMALGIPVIAGDQSGALPWLLHGGKAGRLVDVRDSKAIYTALKNALFDRQGSKTLAVYARKAILDTANPRVVASKYLTAYQGILQ
jgi:glycosyltransferase involved in cell wall biosynthesis